MFFLQTKTNLLILMSMFMCSIGPLFYFLLQKSHFIDSHYTDFWSPETESSAGQGMSVWSRGKSAQLGFGAKVTRKIQRQWIHAMPKLTAYGGG
jgi:hypothetical protein